MTAYLGIYLLQVPSSSCFSKLQTPYLPQTAHVFPQPQSERQQKPFASKLGWALASTTVAAAAELPFDKAKHSISGGLRSAALTNTIRIPLGSLMLIAYDQILSAGNDRRAPKAE